MFYLRISRYPKVVFLCFIFLLVKTITKLNLGQGETFEIKIKKLGSLDNAEFRHFTLLFCTERQRNVPRIITLVHRPLFCSLNLLFSDVPFSLHRPVACCECKLTLQCVTQIDDRCHALIKMPANFFGNEAIWSLCSKPKSGLHSIKIKSIYVVSPILQIFLISKFEMPLNSVSTSIMVPTPNSIQTTSLQTATS